MPVLKESLFDLVLFLMSLRYNYFSLDTEHAEMTAHAISASRRKSCGPHSHAGALERWFFVHAVRCEESALSYILRCCLDWDKC